MLLHHRKAVCMLGEIYSAETLTTIKEILYWEKKYQSFKDLSSLCWTQKWTSVKSLSPSNHTSTRTLPVAWIRHLGSEMLNIPFVKDKGNPAFSKNSEALLRAALPIQNGISPMWPVEGDSETIPTVEEGREERRVGETGKQKNQRKKEAK